MLRIFSFMNRRWFTNPKFLISLVCVNALLATIAIISGNGSSGIFRIVATSIILVLATINHYLGTSAWSKPGLRIWGLMAVIGSAGIELYLLCLIWGVDQISIIPEKVAATLAINSISGLIVSSVFLARPSKLVARVTISACSSLYHGYISRLGNLYFSWPASCIASNPSLRCSINRYYPIRVFLSGTARNGHTFLSILRNVLSCSESLQQPLQLLRNHVRSQKTNLN